MEKVKSVFYLHKKIIIVICISLLIKLFALILILTGDSSKIMLSDSPSYEEPAISLLDSGKFVESFENPDKPMFKRTPGYPGFIALVYFFFGQNRGAILVFQIILSVISILLLYRILLKLGIQNIAVIAGILLAADTLQCYYSLVVLSESLFSFLLLFSVYFGVTLCLEQKNKKKSAFLLGLFMALATLVRPISYYLVFPIVIGMIIFHKQISFRSWKELFLSTCFMLMPFFILVGGWQVRNNVIVGTFEYSGIKSKNMLLFRAAGVLAKKEHRTLSEVQKEFTEQYYMNSDLSDAEREKQVNDTAMKIIFDNPLEYSQIAGEGIVSTLIAPGHRSLLDLLGFDINFESKKTGYDKQSLDYYLNTFVFSGRIIELCLLVFLFFFYLFIYGFSVLGCINLIRNRKSLTMPIVHLFIIGIIIFLLLLGAGPEANSRFRTPLMPLFIFYATIGFDYLTKYFQRKRKEKKGIK
ncbi:MAG: glycosyltransferase family 39 protein [Spirochaetales bacterium]|nr:glycosyltransferase family 39 protein [Spirochaetales bacterium]